jgi:PQQ-dependent catabolism-associated CXXCW motif protein
VKSSLPKKRSKRLSGARRFACAVAVLLGGAVPEPAGYRLDHYKAPVPDTVQGGSVVHLAALPALMAAVHPVLIDVLPAPTPPAEERPGLPRMPLPHNDIPGSLWLPEVGRGVLSPQTESWFRTQLRQATGGNFDKPVVFYCLSSCWMSWNATRRAISYGYTHAIWFPEGADGWASAGHVSQPALPSKQ